MTNASRTIGASRRERISSILIAVVADLAQSGSQVIRATHSPILTALPGTQILEWSDEGIVSRDWEELELTDSKLASFPGYAGHISSPPLE